MIDKHYRKIVTAIIRSRDYHIYNLLYYDFNNHTKGLAWLQIMGLIETQDIIYDR